MADNAEVMPEGTDSIIAGASVEGEAGDGFKLGHGALKAKPGLVEAAVGIKDDTLGAIGEKTAGLRAQAADTARAYAVQGKDKASDVLDNVVKMVGDAAGTIDDKVGAQYGDYARQASDMLAGFATQLREKDVDELVEDARSAVRSSPALAIGAAVAVGFAVVRLVKAGTGVAAAAADSDKSA